MSNSVNDNSLTIGFTEDVIGKAVQSLWSTAALKLYDKHNPKAVKRVRNDHWYLRASQWVYHSLN
jgi:hypothetical protein